MESRGAPGQVSATPASGRLVTLHDGRQVSTWSDDWRHECEARTILAMPSKQARRDFLYGYTGPDGKKFKGVLGVRGEAAVKRLEHTMLALWKQNHTSR